MIQYRTSHQWIAQLAAESGTIAAMHLDTELQDFDLDRDALNLANHEAHTRLISNTIDKLCSSNASSLEDAKSLLKGIISRNTYGSFSELAAYDWLMRNDLKIITQIKMQSGDIIGKNDAFLDGKIDRCGIYFDIKAFGLHGYLAARLKERLEAQLPGEVVLIENTWDVSVDQFSDLLKSPSSLVQTLNQQRRAQVGDLHFRLEKPSPVSISSRIVLPYRLAKENATYTFRSANQFTSHSPFILIFVVHPWFNQSAIFSNFADVDSTFTRALARRAFMQFTNDHSSLNTICKEVGKTVTISDAAKLLSAIIFVNAWPKDVPLDRSTMPSSIYVNPRASYPLNSVQVALLRSSDPHIHVDDFVDDDY